VGGPLERLWTHSFPRYVNQPLIVGGKVIVNVTLAGDRYGSRVVALDAATGRLIWRRSTPGTYFSAHIAANGGRVFSVNTDGVVRAFAADSGAPAWTTHLPDQSFVEAPPVAHAGTVFVHDARASSGSTLYALSAASGAVRWKAQVPLRGFGWPVLDGERVFLADGCGNAHALAQTTGEVVWTRQREKDCANEGVPVVAGGRLFTPPPGPGYTYNAATGADMPALPGGAPGAVAGDLGYRTDLSAVPLAGGPARWHVRVPSGVTGVGEVQPLVVGPTVFMAASDGLYGVDRASGEFLSYKRLAFPTFYSVGGILPGLTAGAGVLLAPTGNRLVAYRSVLRPRPNGIDIGADGFDVVSGRRRVVAARLGQDLRARARKVALSGDEHPYRRYTRRTSLKVLADGTAYGRVTIRRNTHIRFSARGRRSPAITIFAYPRTRSHVRRTSATRGLLTVTMRADRRFRVGGRELVFYFGHARKHRYELLGRGRMTQTGRGRARGSVRFRLLRHVGRRDTIAFCVRGLPRLGYGRNDGFERRCGRPRISFAAASS
jgi:outer membrane protein assembly factor BamB